MTLTIESPVDLVPDIVDDGTRREFVAGGLSLGALLLTGCGDEEAPSASTRMVQTAYGPVEAPTKPKRIVSASYYTPFRLQAVGVEPAGAFDYSNFIEQLSDEQAALVKRTPNIGPFGEPNLEKIAALRPDLLIGEADEIDRGLYSQLARIAPTVVVKGTVLGDWQTLCTRVAEAAGVGERIADARSAYEAELGRLKRQYAEALTQRTWAGITIAMDGQFNLLFPNGITGGVLEQVGVRFVPAVRDGGTPERGQQEYSLERLDVLEPADIVLYPLNSDGSTNPNVKATLSSPLFKRLAAARSKRVYGLDGFYSVTDYATGMRALEVLEQNVLTQL